MIFVGRLSPSMGKSIDQIPGVHAVDPDFPGLYRLFSGSNQFFHEIIAMFVLCVFRLLSYHWLLMAENLAPALRFSFIQKWTINCFPSLNLTTFRPSQTSAIIKKYFCVLFFQGRESFVLLYSTYLQLYTKQVSGAILFVAQLHDLSFRGNINMIGHHIFYRTHLQLEEKRCKLQI